MVFQQLRSYDNYLNANMQLSLLKAQGIQAYIKDEYTVTIDPLFSPALGGMKLMVDEWQYDQAARLLEGLELQYLEALTCPHCGRRGLEQQEEAIRPEGRWRKWAFRILHGKGPVLQKSYRCRSCGHRMKELPGMG